MYRLMLGGASLHCGKVAEEQTSGQTGHRYLVVRTMDGMGNMDFDWVEQEMGWAG